MRKGKVGGNKEMQGKGGREGRGKQGSGHSSRFVESFPLFFSQIVKFSFGSAEAYTAYEMEGFIPG